MLPGGIYKVAVATALAATAATAVFIFAKWRGLREENEEIARDESKLSYRIKSLEDELAYKREYYTRLLHDDKFTERVIREKLGFVGPNELVFRFEDSGFVKVDGGDNIPQFTPPSYKKEKSGTSSAPRAYNEEEIAASANAPKFGETQEEEKQAGFFSRIFSFVFGSGKSDLKESSPGSEILEQHAVQDPLDNEPPDSEAPDEKYEFKIDISKYLSEEDKASAISNADGYPNNLQAQSAPGQNSKLIAATQPKRPTILKLGTSRKKYPPRSLPSGAKQIIFISRP